MELIVLIAVVVAVIVAYRHGSLSGYAKRVKELESSLTTAVAGKQNVFVSALHSLEGRLGGKTSAAPAAPAPAVAPAVVDGVIKA